MLNPDNRNDPASWLWQSAKPILGTIAEIYLRQARGYGGPIPPNFRFLPAKGKHKPALVCPYGLPEDIGDTVPGIQLTKLNADGSDRFRPAKGDPNHEPAKQTLGTCPGVPIVCVSFDDARDNSGLMIGEGVEDVLSACEAMNFAGWAAGGATRMPALAGSVPDHVSYVYILVDDNDAGKTNSSKLASILTLTRDVEVFTVLLEGTDANQFRKDHGLDALREEIDRKKKRYEPACKKLEIDPEKLRLARRAAGEPEWREKFRDGSPKPSLENARLAITAMGVECSLDTFHNKMLFGYRDNEARHVLQFILGEVSDHGIMGLRRLLSDRFGFDLTDQYVRDGVISLALEHCFDPVADMLDKAEGEWDGVKRLDRMAADHLNCEDTPLNAQCVRKTMIAGVARVRQPGIKFDTILVMESEEGWNKSASWLVLAGSDENFSDESIIGKNSREVQEHLATIWIHENAEMAGMRKAEIEAIKAFASRQVDRARPAYGHFLKKQPRHSIEVGSINPNGNNEYLQSQTGNRRFWGMKVLKTIDLEKLKRDRLLLWGEAAHYQSNGECLTIDEAMWPDAAAEQEKRRVKDPWEAVLENMPGVIEVTKWSEDRNGNKSATTITVNVIHIEGGQERVASEVILTNVLEVQVAHQTPAHSMRLASVMKALGWKRDPDGNKITIVGKQVRGYFRDLPK